MQKTHKKGGAGARASVPWYMVVFVLLFVAVLFFDFEHRQKQRFEAMNDQMDKLAAILQRQGNVGGGASMRSGSPLGGLAGGEVGRAAMERSEPVGRELGSVTDYFTRDSFVRGNNSNFFWPYAQQKTPEDIYRFLGTTDVSKLQELVKNTPESVWAEGDERSKKYKVHQYTSSIALRLSGDHLRELNKKLKPYEGKQSTYSILNFDGSMEFSKHWPTYEAAIQPILDQIAATFPHSDRLFLRVLLVRLQKGKSVSQHRDNGCWMRISRRIHVPVITHEKVKFHASNVPKPIGPMRGARPSAAFEKTDELLPVNSPGNIVELNNAQTHYVDNGAPVDRVHLIVDYMADVPNELSYSEAMCVMASSMEHCSAA